MTVLCMKPFSFYIIYYFSEPIYPTSAERILLQQIENIFNSVLQTSIFCTIFIEQCFILNSEDHLVQTFMKFIGHQADFTHTRNRRWCSFSVLELFGSWLKDKVTRGWLLSHKQFDCDIPHSWIQMFQLWKPPKPSAARSDTGRTLKVFSWNLAFRKQLPALFPHLCHKYGRGFVDCNCVKLLGPDIKVGHSWPTASWSKLLDICHTTDLLLPTAARILCTFMSTKFCSNLRH